MKYLILLACVIFGQSCYNVDFEDSQISKIEQTLVNSETLKPIEGMKVYLKKTGNDASKSLTIDSVITNKNGYYAFDVFSISENREYYTDFAPNLYTRDKGYNISKVFYLAPYSWLKVHVKNEQPIDENDKIEIDHYPYHSETILKGKNIDTSYILPISYDYHYNEIQTLISVSTKSGKVNMQHIKFTLKSFDTTAVEIKY
jgi:hypothetical protein